MSFSEEVYTTLSSNLEMKKFLHIVKDNNSNSHDYMDPIGKLTSYYNLTLLQSVKPTNHTPDCTSLPKNNLMIYHKLKFIEHLIYKKRVKHRQKMIEFANNVLEFLIKWKKSDDGMIIHVNEEELKTYLIADPTSVVILLNKFNFYVSLITPIIETLSTKEDIQAELVYVMEDISKSLIKRTSYFPIHRLQERFETLFLSPLLPFKETIDEFIKDFPPQDSQMYLQDLFSFVLSFFNVIKINQKPFDSTLVLLIIRLLFDRIYERNVYLTKEEQDILHELRNITVKEFTPPSDFSPPFSSDETTIVQLFRSDKHFNKAVSELENIVFYTNPFDFLNCVDSSLAAIEKAATEYNNYQTMVFPFEVTFELFMAVVIASQITEWENISKMVNTYTPMVGLCPSFEFSKAKMAASVLQFRNMIDEMNGEDLNDQKEKASDFLINASKDRENKEKEDENGLFTNYADSNKKNSIKNDGSMKDGIFSLNTEEIDNNSIKINSNEEKKRNEILNENSGFNEPISTENKNNSIIDNTNAILNANQNSESNENNTLNEDSLPVENSNNMLSNDEKQKEENKTTATSKVDSDQITDVKQKENLSEESSTNTKIQKMDDESNQAPNEIISAQEVEKEEFSSKEIKNANNKQINELSNYSNQRKSENNDNKALTEPPNERSNVESLRMKTMLTNTVNEHIQIEDEKNVIAEQEFCIENSVQSKNDESSQDAQDVNKNDHEPTD